MTTIEQEHALLKATLKEVLRIAASAEVAKGCVTFEDALDGKLKQEWIDIRKKAKYLVANCQ